jgi:hypothetical protein
VYNGKSHNIFFLITLVSRATRGSRYERTRKTHCAVYSIDPSQFTVPGLDPYSVVRNPLAVMYVVTYDQILSYLWTVWIPDSPQQYNIWLLDRKLFNWINCVQLNRHSRLANALCTQYCEYFTYDMWFDFSIYIA